MRNDHEEWSWETANNEQNKPVPFLTKNFNFFISISVRPKLHIAILLGFMTDLVIPLTYHTARWLRLYCLIVLWILWIFSAINVEKKYISRDLDKGGDF